MIDLRCTVRQKQHGRVFTVCINIRPCLQRAEAFFPCALFGHGVRADVSHHADLLVAHTLGALLQAHRLHRGGATPVFVNSSLGSDLISLIQEERQVNALHYLHS